ncbi:MAG: RidA family protein [Planctomycetota bacterium]|jgi:enamine deaminase RidA (YjgF/YER057c/UK114 family)|nr:RidA family protein [Planctomycetota bacterium]MDP7250512.1 RidA family protein [Planctomycetota bacterium]
MSAEARLVELGIEVPSKSTPVANYVSAVQTGNLVFLSGHGPWKPDRTLIKGKVGSDLNMEEAYEAARVTCLSLLGSLKATIGNLDRVTRIVKLLGMVNAEQGFEDHPKVINGASDLLVEVFGEKGRHARSAVGMGTLPSNIPVEIEMIVEVEEGYSY